MKLENLNKEENEEAPEEPIEPSLGTLEGENFTLLFIKKY